jgi:acyl carrier protein
MTQEEIKNGLNQLFKTVFKQPELEINPEMTASDVEGWDSITHLDLITAVEGEFNIEINGFDVMGLQNVGDLEKLVARKLEE